ncbi:helix-turn-helix domain-containing protein [Clostridium ganghwense]|uniref:Helix-turn-helix domain-containing protein n=1 Tax=Clostridium ganghwense TaxID=312089 RepID=A0ABT4CU95_9CLOT|nr:helix-turn-helix domain-containing protein [Clostridium ganghwense]
MVKKHGYLSVENSPSTTAKRIYEARIEKGLSIKRLAKLSQMDKTYLNKIELGGNVPSSKIIKKLSLVLEKPIWYLGAYDKFPQNTLGERIYKCRLFYGYTQKEFAAVLGVLPETVRNWEKDISTPIKKHSNILKIFLKILKI